MWPCDALDGALFEEEPEQEYFEDEPQEFQEGKCILDHIYI